MAAVWGLSSPMASTPQCQRTAKAQHRSQNTQPHKFRKGPGKEGGRMAPLAKRGREQEEEEFLMDQDMGLDEETIRRVMRLLIRSPRTAYHPRGRSELCVLYGNEQSWNRVDAHPSKHHLASEVRGGTVATSLRATLWGVLLMEWQARLWRK